MACCRSPRKRISMPDLTWLISSTSMTLVAFITSLLAVLFSEWFHIYCLQDATIGSKLTYGFGLWSFCGDDLTWVVNDTSVAGTPGDSVWSCLDINTLVTNYPTWLQGTRWFEVSGCAACGATLVLMVLYHFMPSEQARSASPGFTVANLTAATFFTGSLLTVFAVQNRPTTLVPSGVCNLSGMPSAYSVTLTALAIGANVMSAAITGVVSEGFVASPRKVGNRVVREIDQ